MDQSLSQQLPSDCLRTRHAGCSSRDTTSLEMTPRRTALRMVGCLARHVQLHARGCWVCAAEPRPALPCAGIGGFPAAGASRDLQRSRAEAGS